MFGQNKPFGSGFGTNTFGTPATSSFGQTGTTGFGTTSTFGGTGSTVFGNPTSTGAGAGGTGNLFGSTTPSFGFGTTTTTAGGGLFGNTSSFGTSQPFGASTSTQPLFGAAQQQQQQTKPFGTTFGTSSGTANTGLFGSSTQTGGLFGQNKPASGGLFGGTSAFATPSMQQGQGSCVKFQPTNTGVDTMIKNGVSSQVNTRHQTITLMKEYENKSIEEIRMEDYLLGRKGPQNKMQGGGFGSTFGTTQTSTPSLFGSTSATGGLFGQQQQQAKPLFGGGLGTTTSTTGGLFGQQTSTTSNLFGTQNKPAFGATSTAGATFGFGQTQPASTGGLFGQTQNKPAFGTGTSLFGNTSQPSTSFGTGTGTFGFGTQQSQSGGLFGTKTTFGTATTTAPSFGFGQTSQPSAFGASSSTSLFGKPATGVNPFPSSTPASGFGTSSFGTSTGGFGTTSQPGGLFGASNKPTFTGFGTTPNTSTGLSTGGFGGFGNTTSTFGASKPGGLFGTSSSTTGLGGTTAFGTGSAFGTGTAFGTGSGGLFGSTQQQPAFGAQQQQQAAPVAILNAIGSPYGDSPLFRNLYKRAEKKDELLKPTNLSAQRAYAKPSNLKFRPSLDSSTSGGPKLISRRSVVLSPLQSSLFEGLESETQPISIDVTMHSARKSIKAFRPAEEKQPYAEVTSMLNASRRMNGDDVTSPPLRRPGLANDDMGMTPVSSGRSSTPKAMPEPASATSPRSPAQNGHGDESNEENIDTENIYPAGIVCRRVGYYTIPSAEELRRRVDANGRCFVDGFTIGRAGYGSVFFPDSFDVSGLDLDEIVHIRRKEVVVYPDDAKKPPLDQGLNRQAEVTLDGCWPVSKNGDVVQTPRRLDDMKYTEILEKHCNKMGATFRDYRYETGSWVFYVRHFSKYAIGPEEEEEGFAAEMEAKTQKPGAVVSPKGVKLPPGAAASSPFGAGVEEVFVQNGGLPQVNGQTGEFPHKLGEKGFLARNGFLSAYSPQMEGAKGAEEFENRTKFLSDRLTSPLRDMTNGDEEMEDGQADTEPFPEEPEIEPRRGRGLGGNSRFLSPLAKSLNEGDVSRSIFAPARESTGFFRDDMSPYDDEMDGDILPAWATGAFQERKSLIKGIAPMGVRTDSAAASMPSSLTSPGPGSASIPDDFVDATPGSGTGTTAASAVVQRRPGSSFRGALISDGDGFRFDLYPMEMAVCLPPEDECLPDLKPRPPVGRPETEERASECDVVASRNRALPVCWGPRNQIVHLGGLPCFGRTDARQAGFSLLCFPFEENVRDPGKLFTESIGTTLETLTASQSYVQTLHTSALKVQLENSIFDDSGPCPRCEPLPGVAILHQHAVTAAKLASELRDAARTDPTCKVDETKVLWDLMVALWGAKDANSRIYPDLERYQDTFDHESNVLRKRNVTAWLKSIKRPSFSEEIGKGDKFKKLYDSIVANGLQEACGLAHEAGDVHLAQMLVMGPSHGLETSVKKQLDKWRSTGYDAQISDLHLKVYCLLSGLPIWVTSDRRVINPVEGLDWRRTFALHLWYFTPLVTSVAEAVDSYENSFRGPPPQGQISPYPNPPYASAGSPSSTETDGPVDLNYHLLKLFSNRLYPLESLVSPTGFTSDPLDYRISWLVRESLRAIGYQHLDPEVASSIVRNYASQLEAVGVWEWALFVLQHLEDAEERLRSCMKVLERNVLLESGLAPDVLERERRRERFIVEELHISPRLIAEAKVPKARAAGRLLEEVGCLIDAGQWVKAHDLIISEIAPESIISGNRESLEMLLRKLDQPERKKLILNWDEGGQIYLDFLDFTNEANKAFSRSLPGQLDMGVLKRLSVRILEKQWVGAKQHLTKSVMCQKLCNAAAFLLKNSGTSNWLHQEPSVSVSSHSDTRSSQALLAILTQIASLDVNPALSQS